MKVSPVLSGIIIALLLSGCVEATHSSGDALSVSPGNSPLRQADAKTEALGTEGSQDRNADEPDRPGSSLFGNYLAGQHALRSRDAFRAKSYYGAVLETDPSNFALQRRNFQILALSGDLDQSVMKAEELTEKIGSGAPVARILIALKRAKDGQWARMLELLDSFEDSRLNRVLTPIFQAWAYAGLGEKAKARNALDTLKESDGFQALFSLHKALLLDSLGDQEAAVAAYVDNFDQKVRNSQRAQILTVEALVRLGHVERARVIAGEPSGESPSPTQIALERALNGKPARPTAVEGMSEALFDLASAMQRDRGSDIGLIFARSVVWLNPDHDLGLLLVGEILDDRERFEEALAVYDQIEEASPFFVMAMLRSASSLEDLGREEEGVAFLMRFAKQRPSDYRPWSRMGDLYRRLQAWDKANAAYEQAFQRLGNEEPARLWTLYYANGIALERAKRWDDAEEQFLTALDLNPDQPLVLNYLGYSWIDRGENLERATEMIRKAVELRPEDGYIVDSLGWALYRQGDFPQAVKELERALELRPTDPTINDHLGDALWKVGRRFEARFQWKRALTFEPDEVLRTEIEKKLAAGDRARVSGDTKAE